MTPQSFALSLVVGSALLAAWIVVRFPRLVPNSAKAVSGGLAMAIALFVGTPAAIMLVGRVLGFIVTAMLVVLPAAIGIFLAIAWIMLFVMRAIEPYRR